MWNSFWVSLPSTSPKSPFLSGEIRAALWQITSCGEIKGKYFGFLSPKACLTILERFPQPFCGFRLDDLNWILNLFHWTELLPCMSNFTDVFSKGPDSGCFCPVGHLVSVTNNQLCSCHTKAAEDKAQTNGCDRVPKSITQPHWRWAGFGLLPVVCWPLSYTIHEFYFFFFWPWPRRSPICWEATKPVCHNYAVF